MTSEINISEDLDLFVRQHATDYCAMQLILFFAYHPFTRFSWLAISQYLKQVGKKHPVRKVLADFAEKGIIRMDTRNNVPMYSLSEEIQNTVSMRKKLMTTSDTSGNVVIGTSSRSCSVRRFRPMIRFRRWKSLQWKYLLWKTTPQ